MTRLYQPMDLTVNGYFKNLMRTKWYSKEILKQFEQGTSVKLVKMDMKLTIIKPLHAVWLIEFYNPMSTPDGQEAVRVTAGYELVF